MAYEKKIFEYVFQKFSLLVAEYGMAFLGLTDSTKLMNLLVLQLAPCNLLQLAPPPTHPLTHQQEINKVSYFIE